MNPAASDPEHGVAAGSGDSAGHAVGSPDRVSAPGDADAGGEAGTDESGLFDALQRMLVEGRDVASASQATFGSLAHLAATEFALARSAFVRALAIGAGALVLAWVALLFVLATTSSLLVAAGLSWPAALGLCTLIAVLALAALVLSMVRLLGLARMSRTRRQLAELRGYFG